MSPSWLDGYIDAWLRCPEAGGEAGEEALTALTAFMSDDVRYEDVPTGAVHDGYDGIRQMAAGCSYMCADMTFEVVQRVAGDGAYAFEWICSGTNTVATGPLPGKGDPFLFRGTSIGEVSRAGLVTSQRDYWDLAGLLGQLGVSI